MNMVQDKMKGNNYHAFSKIKEAVVVTVSSQSSNGGGDGSSQGGGGTCKNSTRKNSLDEYKKTSSNTAY